MRCRRIRYTWKTNWYCRNTNSYSYDNNVGDGILYNVHYGVTNDHRAYVSGYVKITTGNYSGNTYYFYQKLA